MRINAISAATTSGIQYGPAERQQYMSYLQALRTRSMGMNAEPRELSVLKVSEDIHQKSMVAAAKIDPIDVLSSVISMRSYLCGR